MRRIPWVTAAAVIVFGSVGCSGSDSPPPAAIPTFSPAAGTYTAPQSVTLACTTPSATIYFTTDGSSPTTASSAYSTPITVSTTTTIKAVAVASGYTASAIGVGTYTINLPTQTATPTFAPAPGPYTSQQSVTLSCETSGAIIYYTLDGSAPTTSSAEYANPITVSATTTIKAIALASGFSESGIASGVYTITPTGQVATPAAAPTFSPPGGSYRGIPLVTLSSTTPGARIYYTHDGSTPTTSSRLYGGPIELAYVLVLKAIAVADGFAPSDVAVATYDIRRTNPTATPTFSPAPGAFASPQQVTVNCATPNAKILYTTDGTLPDIYSQQYSGPITVSSTTTIRASAWVSSGDDLSDLAIGKYTIGVSCGSDQRFPGCYVGEVCLRGSENAYCGWSGGPCLACPADCYCLFGACWYRNNGDHCSAPYSK